MCISFLMHSHLVICYNYNIIDMYLMHSSHNCKTSKHRVCQTEYGILECTGISSNLTNQSVKSPQKPTMLFMLAYADNAPNSLITVVINKLSQQFICKGY